MEKRAYQFTVGDIVYVKNDTEQNMGVVTCVSWWGSKIYSYTVVFCCDGFELMTLDIREELLTKDKVV
jgi:hypothetical protein